MSLKCCLCLALCLAGPAKAQTLSEQRKIFIDSLARFENGAPPPANAGNLKSSQDMLHRLFIRIASTLESEKSVDSNLTPNCRRFLLIANELVRSLDKDVRAYPNADHLERNHLQIALFAFSELTFFLNSQAEGGYSVLDFNMKARCPFEHREILSPLFNRASFELTRFFQLAFGAPGLKQMYAAQKELLYAAIDDESRDRKNLWLIAGAGTLASIAIWELAPLAATRAIAGIKVSALAAEGMVVSYIGSVVTANAEPLKARLGSWEEHMRSLELFLSSPVRSPELQMAQLSRLQEMMLREASTWIEQRAILLEEEQHARLTLGRIELLTLTSGISFEDQLAAASRYIESKFNFRLKCSPSWGFSFSPPSCLLGLQAIAETLFSGQTKAPPEIIEVRITDAKKWRKMNPEENLPSMIVPYSLSPQEFSRFVNSQLESKAYRRRLQRREHLEDLRIGLQTQLGKNVNIDEHLSDAQAEVGLVKLKLLAGSQPEIFVSPAEDLRLSDQFAYPYERSLKLNEDIDWSAGLERIKSYLTDGARADRDFAGDPHWPVSFLSERQNYALAEKEFAMKFKIGSIECSALTLTVRDCISALRRLEYILRQNRVTEPKIDMLVLADRSELNHSMEYSFDSTLKKMILTVRHDIRFREMSRWLRSSGWVP